MPYLNLEDKRRNAARYRASNRKILSEKQSARYAAMTPAQRNDRREKELKRIREKKASGDFNYEPARKCAREQHERKKGDPQYRKMAVERAREWAIKNRERSNATHRSIRKRRIATDISYRLAIALRRRFYMAVKHGHGGGVAVRELGCSIEHFRSFIERQFKNGMSWENWGKTGWHLDHIKPLSSFDLTDAEQARAACHYTNYQPLWATDNIRKGAFYDQAWESV